ncbi:hypothetical protein [Microbacterium paludicola]|uniref:hypothetical protein n=1 Tax=Microbacterium paludicola TaxID=300019 RepID=UPI0011A0F45E|nr:hypothetical protein [Microbacterium paludicola]
MHARSRPNLVVHDSDAPLDAKGQIVRDSYVVMHDVGPDEIGDNRFAQRRTASSGRTMRVVGRCVGVDPAAARRVAGAFKTQMDGFEILTAGRKCWPLVIDDESEADKDTKVSPPLWFVDIDMTYRSDPAE